MTDRVTRTTLVPGLVLLLGLVMTAAICLARLSADRDAVAQDRAQATAALARDVELQLSALDMAATSALAAQASGQPELAHEILGMARDTVSALQAAGLAGPEGWQEGATLRVGSIDLAATAMPGDWRDGASGAIAVALPQTPAGAQGSLLPVRFGSADVAHVVAWLDGELLEAAAPGAVGQGLVMGGEAYFVSGAEGSHFLATGADLTSSKDHVTTQTSIAGWPLSVALQWNGAGSPGGAALLLWPIALGGVVLTFFAAGLAARAVRPPLRTATDQPAAASEVPPMVAGSVTQEVTGSLDEIAPPSGPAGALATSTDTVAEDGPRRPRADPTDDIGPEQGEAHRRRVLSNLAENFPGAVFQFSMPAEGHGSMIYMSPSSSGLWGLSPEDVIADYRRLWPTVHKDDLKIVEASVRWAARTGEPWSCRWRSRQADGSFVWLDGRGSSTLQDDGARLWNGVVLDVTDQVEAEQKLKKSRELLYQARKMEAIGNLTGGIAHDFNNLLTVVLGNLDLIKLQAEGLAEDGVLIDTIAAARRGADLTRQLLAFGRRAPLNPKPVNINETLLAMDRLLRRTLPANINVETVLAGSLRDVDVDQAQLETVILNLVLNARDAMEDGGQLVIETKNTTLTAKDPACSEDGAKPGDYVELRVTDTGHGMTPRVRDNAFEPFFTTKSVGQGSGMGLAMAHGFARQSGGAIRLVSEVDEGTVVSIFFPVTAPQASAVIGADALSVPGGTERILLVEDDPRVRRTIFRQLVRLGYDVAQAENGDVALAQFLGDPGFDIIVTDMVMPGILQGPDLAKSIRQQFPDTPVIFVTGYASEALSRADGVRKHDPKLIKPVSLEVLAKSLREQLGGAEGRD